MVSLNIEWFAAGLFGAVLVTLIVRRVLGRHYFPDWNTRMDLPRPRTSGRGPQQRRSEAATRSVMQVVVTVAVLGAALGIIVAGEDADAQKWAFGIVGTIIGFWLK